MKKLIKWIAIAFAACVVLGVLASIANNGKGSTATATPTTQAQVIVVSTQLAVQATSQPEPADLATATARAQPATIAPTSAPTLAPTDVPQPSATDVPTDIPLPAPTPAPMTSGTANLRSGPGTNYPVAGALPSGKLLAIVASNQDRTWYELADKRWVFGQLVSNAPTSLDVAAVIPLPPAPTATSAPLPAPTVEPTVATPPQPAYTGLPECQGLPGGARYGATCGDGSRSGATGSGACSHHGGVAQWLTCP